jgi:soluble lytic murein transglycosylase-like protein
MGLMQLMQETSRIYNVRDPFDPEENLNAGIKHMKGLLNYFNNDIPLALAAYHAGIGVVKKRMKVPPIKSTIAYVKKIMKLYRGNNDPVKKVKKLYKRIEKDGTILIYSR